MRGRPFVPVWREGDTEAAPKAACLAERHGALRSGLRARWLLRTGQAPGAAAGVLGVYDRPAQRRVAWYR
jgi:hypothetical protein